MELPIPPQQNAARFLNCSQGGSAPGTAECLLGHAQQMQGPDVKGQRTQVVGGKKCRTLSTDNTAPVIYYCAGNPCIRSKFKGRNPDRTALSSVRHSLTVTQYW